MRFTLLHHGWESLPGEFACHVSPPIEKAMARAICASDEGDEFAVKLRDEGTGIWKATGELRHHFPQGADLCWLNGSRELLSLEVRRFGPAYQSDGVCAPAQAT